MKSWKRPTWSVIKMDAEISSYQEDPDPWQQDPVFVQRAPVIRSAPQTVRKLDKMSALTTRG